MKIGSLSKPLLSHQHIQRLIVRQPLPQKPHHGLLFRSPGSARSGSVRPRSALSRSARSRSIPRHSPFASRSSPQLGLLPHSVPFSAASIPRAIPVPLAHAVPSPASVPPPHCASCSALLPTLFSVAPLPQVSLSSSSELKSGGGGLQGRLKTPKPFAPFVGPRARSPSRAAPETSEPFPRPAHCFRASCKTLTLLF